MTALNDVEVLLWIIMNKMKSDGLVRLGGDIIGFIKKGVGKQGEENCQSAVLRSR